MILEYESTRGNVNNLTFDPEFTSLTNMVMFTTLMGDGADNDVANDYFGIVDENGTAVVINGKGDDSSLGYMTGFYRDLPGLTDFAKLDTYRIKLRLGYALILRNQNYEKVINTNNRVIRI